MKCIHYFDIGKEAIYLGVVGDDSTLETSPAEDDDRVLLCVHLPLQLKNHAGKWNPTCKRQEKYHS
jgi:hypothetical protein